MPTECSWAADLVSRLQAAVFPLSGLNGQHSPAVNIDLRETYAKSNVTEKQNKAIIPKSREPILPSSCVTDLVSHWPDQAAVSRLLKSTDGKENELWIELCPVVNLPKSKGGNRSLFLCLTTTWQHPKWKMGRLRTPQRFASRGMGRKGRNQDYQCSS